VRGLGQTYAQEKRRKPFARALAVAFVASISMTAAGCASIGAMFGSPDATEPKPVVRKSAPVKAAVSVTPERRAEAKALHATALDQMGRGAFGPATSNLRHAAKLDPTNEQIRRDLARANRIRTAIGAGEAPPRRTATN
jgi:hypothetical protein